jgi:hypothetical protein
MWLLLISSALGYFTGPLFVVLAQGGVAVLYLATIFIMRNEMEDEPIGLVTGGAMTFFFGPYYFQYWVQDYVFVRLTSSSRNDRPATSQEPALQP